MNIFKSFLINFSSFPKTLSFLKSLTSHLPIKNHWKTPRQNQCKKELFESLKLLLRFIRYLERKWKLSDKISSSSFSTFESNHSKFLPLYTIIISKAILTCINPQVGWSINRVEFPAARFLVKVFLVFGLEGGRRFVVVEGKIASK